MIARRAASSSTTRSRRLGSSNRGAGPTDKVAVPAGGGRRRALPPEPSAEHPRRGVRSHRPEALADRDTEADVTADVGPATGPPALGLVCVDEYAADRVAKGRAESIVPPKPTQTRSLPRSSQRRSRAARRREGEANRPRINRLPKPTEKRGLETTLAPGRQGDLLNPNLAGPAAEAPTGARHRPTLPAIAALRRARPVALENGSGRPDVRRRPQPRQASPRGAGTSWPARQTEHARRVYVRGPSDRYGGLGRKYFGHLQSPLTPARQRRTPMSKQDVR